MSQKDFLLRGTGVHLLQLGLVVEVAGIVKILRPGGTALDAGDVYKRQVLLLYRSSGSI